MSIAKVGDVTEETREKQELTELWCQFDHIEKAEDDPNVRNVYGLVSDTHTDMDRQRCDGPWLRGALTNWFNEWGNIREMHQPKAVGKAVALVEEQPDEWFLTARIVDEDAVRKIDEGVLKGYSIHVAWPKLKRDPKGEAPMGLICGGDIVETSIVDRPSRSAAKIALVKAIGVEPEPDNQALQEAWAAGDFNKAMEIMKAASKEKDPVPTGYSDADEDEGVGGGIPTAEEGKNVVKAAGEGGCDDCDCSDCDPSDPDCDCCDSCHGDSASKAAGDNGRRSPPKGYPKNKDQYAGPSSYSFPVDTKVRTRSAMAYYNAGKGKQNHSESEWASIGRRIAAAANRFFGPGHTYSDGKVTSPESKKLADVREGLTKHLSLLKGKVNPEAVSVAELMNTSEMEDSQIALVAAEMVRTLMIRELHEGYSEGEEDLSPVMGQLAALYDSLIGIAKEEYEEAFEYQAAATLSQLMTGHTLEQGLEDAALAKMGKALSTDHASMISQAHHALAMCMKGADCSAYMKMAGSESEPEDRPKEVSKMADAEKTEETREEENTEVNSETTEETTEEETEITKAVKAVQADFTTKMEQFTAAWAQEKEALTSELEELRNRAAPEGPIVTAVTKALGATTQQTKLLGMKAEMTKAWDSAMRNQDPALRADAFSRYVKLKNEIKELEASMAS